MMSVDIIVVHTYTDRSDKYVLKLWIIINIKLWIKLCPTYAIHMLRSDLIYWSDRSSSHLIISFTRGAYISLYVYIYTPEFQFTRVIYD